MEPPPATAPAPEPATTYSRDRARGGDHGVTGSNERLFDACADASRGTGDDRDLLRLGGQRLVGLGDVATSRLDLAERAIETSELSVARSTLRDLAEMLRLLPKAEDDLRRELAELRVMLAGKKDEQAKVGS